MPVPIIIPINTTHTRTRDCIAVEGQRYCESTPISPKDIGYAAFGVVALMLWFLFWGWIAIEEEEPVAALIGGIFAPLVILGIVMLWI